MRVLVADDTVDIAVWLSHTLTNAGFDTRLKVCGFGDLLTEAAWVAIDAVVLDAMMPEVGGVEIARFVKDKCPHVRVVMATGSITAAEEATGLADVVLLKPFDSEDVVAALRG